MSQIYSDPSRESDPYALPDVETFKAHYAYCPECGSLLCSAECKTGACHECHDLIVPLSAKGWFYWFCFPGCLPDSDPIGPFPTEAEAIADAQAGQ